MEQSDAVQAKIIDPSTLIGVLIAFLMVFLAIYMGGNPEGFLDARSFLIVCGGTFAVTTACFSISDVLQAQSSLIHTIFYKSDDIMKAAIRSIDMSEIARTKGFLELDNHANLTRHNRFFKRGIEMIVDGVSIEQLEKALEYEIDAIADRHYKSVFIIRKSAEIAPAMGLIGTLIGLVQMLASLNEVDKIGPAMAVALLTTFYGAVLSYIVFTPLAAKLERNTKGELLVLKVYMQAMLSIAKKENPRKLEIVINSILPPAKRVNYFDIRKQREGNQQGMDI